MPRESDYQESYYRKREDEKPGVFDKIRFSNSWSEMKPTKDWQGLWQKELVEWSDREQACLIVCLQSSVLNQMAVLE